MASQQTNTADFDNVVKALVKQRLKTDDQSFAEGHKYAKPLKGTKKYSDLFKEGIELYKERIKAEVIADLAAQEEAVKKAESDRIEAENAAKLKAEKEAAEELAAKVKAEIDVKESAAAELESQKADEEVRILESLRLSKEAWEKAVGKGVQVVAQLESGARGSYMVNVMKMQRCKDMLVGSLTFEQYVRLTTVEHLTHQIKSVKLADKFGKIPPASKHCEACENFKICR